MSGKKIADLKTWALVLRRTNYGESDRILNLITPYGKFSAIAKGVRKAKSKLAGSVEMFTLFEANLHFGKSGMAILTGANMVRFYNGILKDLGRMTLAADFLKKINRASENLETPDFFEILDKSLVALNGGNSLSLVEAWFVFNLARVTGEQLNLYTDSDGKKLEIDKKYSWNESEMVLVCDDGGRIDADAIKIMRLMWSVDIDVILRVKNIEEYLPEILKIAKCL